MHFLTTYAHFLKKLPSPIYKWFGQKWIDYGWPRHLFIELTSDCNLQCPHCPRPRISHNLSFELFEKIVGEASLHGHRSFSLHLFGEPLLYPRIIDCIRYLKRRGHAVILTTNGLLLGRLYRELKSCDKIIWSYKKGIKVPEALKTWKNFTVRFFEGEEVDKSWPRREVRPYHNYGGTVPSIAPFMEKRWACYHPFLAPAVRANGDIVICCADPEGKSVVGNANNMTISEAWKRMDKTRREHLKGEYKGICERCDVWKSYPSLF